MAARWSRLLGNGSHGMPQKRRTVVWEDSFLRDLYRIQSDRRKADLFIEGAEQYLVRAPDSGVQIYEGSPVWMISVPEIANFPPLSLFYAFNDDYVFALSIRLRVEER